MTWTRPPIGCHGPTTNSPEPKKSSQKLEERKKKKKPLPQRAVDVMKPTPLCNAGITTDCRATRGRPSFKDNTLPYCRHRCVHTPISWHRVDCCYCCCYHFSFQFRPPPSRKRKHNLYASCPFPLTTVCWSSWPHMSRATTFFNPQFHFRLSFTLKGLGTNRNGTLKESP